MALIDPNTDRKLWSEPLVAVPVVPERRWYVNLWDSMGGEEVCCYGPARYDEASAYLDAKGGTNWGAIDVYTLATHPYEIGPWTEQPGKPQR